MKDIIALIIFGMIVVGSLAIGAWLIIEGHPWAGVFAMLIGSTVRLHWSGESDASGDDEG